jgi:hypothetical protein
MNRIMQLFCGCVALLAMAIAYIPDARSAQAAPAAPVLQFRPFVATPLPLDAIAWSGSAFKYGGEAKRMLMTSSATGQQLRQLVSLPRNGGEIRCVTSPGMHGFAADAVYCHTANAEIYRIGTDHTPHLLARLPTNSTTDGALAFDNVGAFGYALLAASGGSTTTGGAVYAVASSGQVRQIGAYTGPGGAENLAIAPAGFGPAAGQVLISVDQVNQHGRLLAMNAQGKVRVLLSGLANGLNPLVVITGVRQSGGQGPAPGLYLAEWISRRVLFAPAAELRAFVGDVLVGTEHGGQLIVVRPSGSGYQFIQVQSSLRTSRVYLEGATFIGA